MRILIASDGSECAREAALYACHFARPARAEVVLLGVAEKPSAEATLRSALEALREEIAQRGVSECLIKMRYGEPPREILAETEEHAYHLTLVGARGHRRLIPFAVGGTTMRLAQHIRSPLLIVTRARPAIREMLICTSGEQPAENNALVGGALAALVGAQVTVLHVMSQLPLAPDAKVEDLERSAEELIASGAREGLHLQRLLEILEAQGVERTRSIPKVRHGLVIDEILNEVREGDYDLIVIGARPVLEGQSWWQWRTLFLENIPNHILTRTRRPVLVVRPVDWSGWQLK